MNYKTQIIDRLRSEIRREAQYIRRISESNLSDGVQRRGKGLLI